MAEALKSTSITNLDATPRVANTAGRGAPGRLECVTDVITPSTAAGTGSTYRMVRLPSNAVVKQVLFEAAAMSTGLFNLSVYYSDDADNINAGVIVATTGDSFFASAISCASAVALVDKTNASGNYPLSARNKELWDALALATDPGGFFDIVAVSVTSTVATGAAMGVYAYFVMP